MGNQETSDGGGTGFFGNIVNNLSSLAGTAATITDAVRGSKAPVANASLNKAPRPSGTMSPQTLWIIFGASLLVVAGGVWLLFRKKG